MLLDEICERLLPAAATRDAADVRIGLDHTAVALDHGGCGLGPSTPILPEVFGARGVTLLSGVRVADRERAMRVVSEGGGTRQFGGAVKKLTLRVNP